MRRKSKDATFVCRIVRKIDLFIHKNSPFNCFGFPSPIALTGMIFTSLLPYIGVFQDDLVTNCGDAIDWCDMFMFAVSNVLFSLYRLAIWRDISCSGTLLLGSQVGGVIGGPFGLQNLLHRLCGPLFPQLTRFVL